MAENTWTVVDPSLPALTCSYVFGPGVAKALAVAVDGGVAVVSPPCNPSASCFEELEKTGPVRALVASNAYHYLGLPAWKARYPDAPVFAPAQSIARLEKRSKIAGIRPLSEAKLGGRVELVDMPHYKTGEVLVRWPIEGGGYAWYVTDVMFNMRELPRGPFGWIMKWTRSGPGLRRNALAGPLMIKDKRALYAWLAEQAEKTPPKLVVACHLDVARLADPPAEMRAALA